MSVYYNEHDPFAAEWLRELIRGNHIASGEVDERSIVEVQPEDLRGFTQCHFFAGLGAWSYALRLAGWTDDRPAWTGSCPCQPFSASGKQEGFADPRHLWPEWFRLIRECRPVAIFGEQVAAGVRQGWLDLVSGDLEGLGYAVGSAVMGAHSVGAPHIRQRLYFVADHPGERLEEQELQLRQRSDELQVGNLPDVGAIRRATGELGHARKPRLQIGQCDRGVSPSTVGTSTGKALECPGIAGRTVGDTDSERRQQIGRSASGDEAADGRTGRDGSESDGDNLAASAGEVRDRMGDPEHPGHRIENGEQAEPGGDGPEGRLPDRANLTNGFWRDAQWLWCRDGKYRPVEPGTFPLAHGSPARVGRLRGYGNAIVAPQAEAFIRAYIEVTGESS